MLTCWEDSNHLSDPQKCNFWIRFCVMVLWIDASFGEGFSSTPPTLQRILPGDTANLTWVLDEAITNFDNSLFHHDSDLIVRVPYAGGDPTYGSGYNENKVTTSGRAGGVSVGILIKDITIDDAGRYSCSHTTPDGTKYDNKSVVFVYETLVKPEIKIDKNSSQLVLGDTVKLSCLSTSRSQPASEREDIFYTWKRNSDVIDPKNAPERHKVQGTHNEELTITNITRVDRVYQCAAVEGAMGPRSDQETFSFDVKYGPSQVKISPAVPQLRASVGEDIQATCTADCNPDCVYQWYRGQSTISSPESGVLELPSIQTDQADNYTCQASNDFGSQSAAIEIFVSSGTGNGHLCVDSGCRIALASLVFLMSRLA